MSAYFLIRLAVVYQLAMTGGKLDTIERIDYQAGTVHYVGGHTGPIRQHLFCQIDAASDPHPELAIISLN